MARHRKVVVLTLSLVALCAIASMYIWAWNQTDPIADSPSVILDVKSDGKFCVDSYIWNMERTIQLKCGYLQGVGPVNAADGRRIQEFVSDLVETEYVSVALDSDGLLHILYLEKQGTGVRDLNDDLQEYLSDDMAE